MYSKFLDPSEIRRISRIEMFDEFEEWHLIQAHYCIVVAGQGSFAEWFDEMTRMAMFLICFEQTYRPHLSVISDSLRTQLTNAISGP